MFPATLLLLWFLFSSLLFASFAIVFPSPPRLDRSVSRSTSSRKNRPIPSTKFTGKLLITVAVAPRRDAPGNPGYPRSFFRQRTAANFRHERTSERASSSGSSICEISASFLPRGPFPVTKVITFSDVRWTTISYRRGIATYRALSLARTGRILFLGCGFARYTLLGNWTWSGHAGSALAAHLLPLLYLWVAKFTKRCGPSSECLPYNAPVQRRHSTLHGSKPSDELARRPRTPSISQKTFQKFRCSRPPYPGNFSPPPIGRRRFPALADLPQISSSFIKFDQVSMYYRYPAARYRYDRIKRWNRNAKYVRAGRNGTGGK